MADTEAYYKGLHSECGQILSLVQGQYRNAFMALRVFLEQGMAAVYFSANELQLRSWMMEEQDIMATGEVGVDEVENGG